MPYTAANLRALFRSEMDDPLYPGEVENPTEPDSDSLWKDIDINDYMDQAQEELCRKIDVIPDSRSFRINVKANTAYYERDPLITEIRRGQFQNSPGRQVRVTTVRDMDRGYLTNDYGDWYVGEWRTAEGDPRYIVTDDTIEQLRLVPKPVEDGVIELITYRLPETRIIDGGELEVPDMFRRKLLLRMRSLGYLKNDSETFNSRQSDRFLGLWEDYLAQVELDVKRGYGARSEMMYGGI